MQPEAASAWTQLQTHFFEALSVFYAPDVESRWLALQAVLQGLGALLGDLRVAYQCPLSCTRHFRLAAEWSLALGHPQRARALLQLGNVFKLQAMARWWTASPQAAAVGAGSAAERSERAVAAAAEHTPKRFEPRMQVEYTIAITQLHGALQVPLRPVRRFAGLGSRPRVEIHSICVYKPDPTSNTGLQSPLPDLSVPNHRAYAERHGHRYVLHTELPLPDREAHYSKMLVVHDAMRSAEPPDWVFFIDCDAFFTNADVAVADILETYSAAGTDGPHFLVAEDPGGINTGTLLFRRSAWSLAFLERVAESQFGVAWDQSMFLSEMLRPGVLELEVGSQGQPRDFHLPPEVALVHQAHINAFVPPASRDWSAYEWQPGDYVRHFAGCPWQEEHCLRLMRETVAYR